jgi:integrase
MWPLRRYTATVSPLKAIQDLLGHATIQMTMRYAHLAPESRAMKQTEAHGNRTHRAAARAEHHRF